MTVEDQIWLLLDQFNYKPRPYLVPIWDGVTVSLVFPCRVSRQLISWHSSHGCFCTGWGKHFALIAIWFFWTVLPYWLLLLFFLCFFFYRLFPYERTHKLAMKACSLYSNPFCESTLLEVKNVPEVSRQLVNMSHNCNTTYFLFDAKKLEQNDIWINNQVKL